MRIASWLAVAFYAAAAVGAQNVIEWSNERRLSKSDFKGRVPLNTAVTSMSWLSVDVSWECEAGELFGTARATFDPARSWWRLAQGNIWQSDGTRSVSRAREEARRSVVERDVQLLDHEQLHFDMTELAARRVRKRFADSKDVCGDPDQREDLRHAIAEIDRELDEEQSRYDRETSHGINTGAQDQWKRRIRKQLEQP
jgi:hypothetical protein